MSMLPKSFQQQNIEKKNNLTSKLKLYTIHYDYELSKYYGEFIKESYDTWGNIVDILGIMQLTGYDKEEVEFNFNQIMQFNYIHTHKIKDYNITDITEELVISKPIF